MMLEYCNREGSLSNSYEHQDEIKKKEKKEENEKIKKSWQELSCSGGTVSWRDVNLNTTL